MKKVIIGIILGLIISNTLVFSDNISPKIINMSYFFNNNRQELPDDCVTLEYNDRVYVPIRFVSENLGKDVFWQEGEIRVQDKKSREIVNKSRACTNGEYDFYRIGRDLIAHHRWNQTKATILNNGLYSDEYIYMNGSDLYYVNDKGNLSCYDTEKGVTTEIALDFVEFVPNDNGIYYTREDTEMDLLKEPWCKYTLFKYDPIAKTHTQVLEKMNHFMVLECMDNNYIYFKWFSANVNHDPNYIYTYSLNRINLKNYQVEELHSSNSGIGDIYLTKDNLFFCAEGSNGGAPMYSMDLTTKEKKIIIDKFYNFAVDEDFVYYVSDSDDGKYNLHKANHDGSDDKIIIENNILQSFNLRSFNDFSISDDWLYSCVIDWKMVRTDYRIKKDGSVVEVIKVGR